MKNRYVELDSLRGVAAVSVVLSHLSLVISGVYFFDKLKNTPFHIFWAGHEAVILFFILSGFVLSLPYLNDKAPSYKEYIIKRLCRIYIPYIFSIVLAIACMYVFYTNIPELTKWFNNLTTPPLLSLELIINHIFMLNEFNTDAFNGVIWSLVHEMRISLIFPILMYLLKRYDWKGNIIIAMTCSFVYFLLYYSFLKAFKYDMTLHLSSYFTTLHYIAFFIVGALLAKYRNFLHQSYLKWNNYFKIGLILFGVLAYTYAFWFPRRISILHHLIVDDWFIAIGSSIFIIFCLNSRVLKKIMHLPAIHFVGKISYSLYLIHLVVIFTMISFLYGKLNIGFILLGSFIVSFIIASIMYYLVEKPSIKLGKFFSAKLNKEKPINKKEAVPDLSKKTIIAK